MLSQCPQCRSIFDVSEAHISAHHGLVRCGHCRKVFHAVENEVAAPPTYVDDPAQSDIEDLAGGGPTAPALTTADDEHQPATPEADPAEPENAPRRAGRSEAEQVSEAILAEGFTERQDQGGPPDQTRQVDERAEESETRHSGWQETPEGEVEEILIEAPPVLGSAFDDDLDESSDGRREPDASTTVPGGAAENREPAPAHASGKSRAPSAPAGVSPGMAPEDRRAPKGPASRARDIVMAELPRPTPLRALSLVILSVLLVLVLVWQVKAYYLDELAQLPALRPFLERLCQPLDCDVPPRQSFSQIDLVGTSISLNPRVPGALEIKASLINRAHFPQPYPLLRVTLTDREGRIVGRRTYLPSEYRARQASGLLPTREIKDVSINLAQPAEDAVGYEIELVSPRSQNS